MWAIINNTPFQAERGWVRDKDGAEVWLVAVKGTFLIQTDGTLSLAEEQEEVRLAPVFRGDPAETSLLYDSDLVHKKSATDVLVHGHAYAPRGRPAIQVDVTLKLGPIAKTLRVIGDRLWQDSVLGLRLTQPEPFTKVPLTYERAFGGSDQLSDDPKHHDWERLNPVGRGFATRPEHLIDTPVANIEAPNLPITHWKSRPPPAGFGPIPGHWSPRVELAGTYDEKWERERLPLLAEDFDERFHQSAPVDQQVPGFLRGGEEVELRNLTPGGILRCRLPRVSLGIITAFEDGERRRHQADFHTVAFEPDVPRVMLVWHTHLPCHHKVLELRTTTIHLRKRNRGSERDRAGGL